MEKKAIIHPLCLQNVLVHRGLLHFASLLTLLFLFLIPLTSLAQDEVPGVVYLKNGSVLRGEITELVQDSILKIRVMKTNVFVFKWEEIDRYEIGLKQNYVPRTNAQGARRSALRIFPKPGYHNSTEVGLLMGMGSFFSSAVSLTFSNISSWRFNQYIQPGIGVGVDRWIYQGTILPVFADFRSEFLKERMMTPYGYASFGYGISPIKSPWYEKFDGGLMYQAGLGLKFYSRSKVSYSWSLGFRSQSIHRVYEEVEVDWWTGQTFPTGNIIDIRQTFQRITMMVGLSF